MAQLLSLRAGYVYFAQAVTGEPGQPVKIGWATNPWFRVYALQGGYPFGDLAVIRVISGGLPLEAKFRRRFAHLRIRGEWFRAEPELGDFINSLPLVESRFKAAKEE